MFMGFYLEIVNVSSRPSKLKYLMGLLFFDSLLLDI